MIWSTYKVFGSGSSGVTSWYRQGMTLAQCLEARDKLQNLATDDGDNGFMGTRSVPDDVAGEYGIYRELWSDPGTTFVPREIEGMVCASYSLGTMEKYLPKWQRALPIDTIESYASLSRDIDDLAAILNRRAAIIRAVQN